MKKNRILLAVIPALLLPACSRQTLDFVEPTDSSDPDGTAETIVITADVPATKTTLDGLAVKWTETDAIVVNGGVSTGINLLSDGASATFSVPATTAPYHALYPASAYVAGSYAGGTSSLTVPAMQTYTAGSFDPAAAIMTGVSDKTGITFHHAMAYLKLTVSSESYEAAVASVMVTAPGGEALSGTFTAKADGTGIVAAGGNAASVAVEGGEGIALDAPIFVAIPAGTYADGLSVRIKDVNYRYQDLALAAGFTAEAGKVYPANLAYLPDGVELDGPITTPAQWAAFADAVSGVTEEGRVLVDGARDFAGETITIGADLSVDGCFAYADGTFQGTLDGGGHVFTANGNKWPLFNVIGASGTVKDLTVAGKFTDLASWGQAGNAVIARQNLGLIQGVTNQATTDLTVTGALVFGTIVCQNGGILKDCVNEGDIIFNVTTFASSVIYGGGLAAAGHTLLSGIHDFGPVDVDETCSPGTFINCVNKGNIKIVVVDGNLPTKAAFGGICGVSYKDGVSFKDCRNEGWVARFDNGVIKANGVASCLGGILGRSAATHTSTSLAVIANDTYGYHITFDGCVNTGRLEHLSRNNSNLVPAALASETGARRVYTGGIAGLVVGSSATPAEMTDCINTGVIATGWSSVRSHVPGGLMGGATNVTVKDCSAAFEVVSSDSNEASSASPRAIGACGGVAGMSFGGLSVSGGKFWMDADIRYYQDGWQGLLLALNIEGTSSFSNVSVGGSIRRASTESDARTIVESITADSYTGYLYSASSPVAPTIGTTTWLSAKPAL